MTDDLHIIEQKIEDHVKRQQRIRKLIANKRAKKDDLEEAIDESRRMIDSWQARKRELTRRIERRVEQGLEPKERAEDRKEELGDLIEEEHADLDRLLDRRDEVDDNTERWVRQKKQNHNALERLRKRRHEIRVDEKGRMSPHFHIREFDCRDGTRVPEAAIPALKHLCQNYLEPLRNSGGIVHINSGFRTRAYNASVGGASNSVHIYNEHPNAVAADHWQEGRSPAQVQAFHDSHTHPDGMGYYSSFTHVDNRNRIGWSDSRWNGP